MCVGGGGGGGAYQHSSCPRLLEMGGVISWRASMFMSFEICDTYVYAPEILKWLRKTRGTQYAVCKHTECARMRIVEPQKLAYFTKSRILASWLIGVAVSKTA